MPHTVRAFAGRLNPAQPQLPQTVNAFRLGAVRPNSLLSIAPPADFRKNLLIAHAPLINLIKNVKPPPRQISQSTKKGRFIIHITKIQAKNRPHARPGRQLPPVKISLPPILKNQTLGHAPFPQPGHLITPGVLPGHSLKHPQIRRVQKLIAAIIHRLGQNIRVRPTVKKAFFQPVSLIPGIKRQCQLLKRSLATDTLIQNRKILLPVHLKSLLQP